MKRITWAALVAVAVASISFAQSTDAVKEHEGHDANSCPMHAEHMKGHDHSGVSERGADEHGMGFSQEATVHHFRITREGGVIEVRAKNPKDKDTIAQVQMHINHIAQAFAAGDFTIPHFVHAQDPPGVKTMQERKSDLSYKPEKMKDGARLVITASSDDTMKALHEFLRFQIEEHETGDATTVAVQ